MDLTKIYEMLKFETDKQTFVEYKQNGQTWLYATGPDAGDYIFRLNAKSELGETVFKMVDGSTHVSKSYWHENAEEFFRLTGVDLRNKRAYWFVIKTVKNDIVLSASKEIQYGNFYSLLSEVDPNYRPIEFNVRIIHRTGSVQKTFKSILAC